MFFPQLGLDFFPMQTYCLLTLAGAGGLYNGRPEHAYDPHRGQAEAWNFL